MVELREELRLALNAFEREPLDQMIRTAREEDFQSLRQLIEAPDTAPGLRRQALYAIGRWPGHEQERIDIIAGLMRNLGEVERITAIDALSQIGAPEATEAVLAHASDPAPDVRRQVAIALGRLGTKEAVQALRHLAATDNKDYVRERAAELLHRFE